MDKLYYDSSLIVDECFNYFGLKVYKSNEYEGENYIDDEALWDIVNEIIENIKNGEVCTKLNDIGIYLDINCNIDKSIWNDYDNNYVDW